MAKSTYSDPIDYFSSVALRKYFLGQWLFFAFLPIVVAVSVTGSFEHIIKLILIMPITSAVWCYFSIYHSNLNLHQSLEEKYGEEYLKKFEKEVQAKGIDNLVKEDWFYKINKNGITENLTGPKQESIGSE